MVKLSPKGQELVDKLAQRYNISSNAVQTLLEAIYQGSGTMAQFNHPDLGGFGQWMPNGMTMIGDMFNQNLKSTVTNLGNELAAALANDSKLLEQDAVSTDHQASTANATNLSHWWPNDLGSPSTSGAQNQVRYAWFPSSARLAIEQNGKVTVYDTKDHQISGVAQQQDGSGSSLTFTSQYGRVKVDSLPVVK